MIAESALALAVLCLAAAAFDAKTRRIPNWLNLLILVAGALSLALLPSWQDALWHLAHFAVALMLGMALFSLRLWGGGDAKFYAAVALWLPLAQAPSFAMATALSGALLVPACFAWARAQSLAGWAKELPYGVAIAGGALFVILTRWLAES